MPQTFFLAMDTLCMGYEYCFQKFTRWLLLSMLISTASILQLLILEKFFSVFFINTAPSVDFSKQDARRNLVVDSLPVFFPTSTFCQRFLMQTFIGQSCIIPFLAHKNPRAHTFFCDMSLC